MSELASMVDAMTNEAERVDDDTAFRFTVAACAWLAVIAEHNGESEVSRWLHGLGRGAQGLVGGGATH